MRGRAAAFGESAFLRAASDIGGPLRELIPSPFGTRDRHPILLVSPSSAGRKGKKGWLCPRERVSAREREAVKDRPCIYICVCAMCVRSFRRPYVGLVMRERKCSLFLSFSVETGRRVLDETLYRLSPRPHHCFTSRGYPVNASTLGNVNYAGCAINRGVFCDTSYVNSNRHRGISSCLPSPVALNFAVSKRLFLGGFIKVKV